MNKNDLKKYLFKLILEEKKDKERHKAFYDIIKSETDFKQEISIEIYRQYINLNDKTNHCNRLTKEALLRFSISFVVDLFLNISWFEFWIIILI